MTVPTSYKNPTGVQNLLQSVNKWLVANVPSAGASDWTWYFGSQLEPMIFPHVEVLEMVTPMGQNSGEGASYGLNLFPRASTSPVAQQTLGRPRTITLEVNIRTDVAAVAAALLKLRQIRDRIVRGFTMAGVSLDTDDTVPVDPIKVLDYDNASAETGIVAHVPTEDDNSIIGRYFSPNVDQPNIHRYQLLVKLSWYEMVN